MTHDSQELLFQFHAFAADLTESCGDDNEAPHTRFGTVPDGIQHVLCKINDPVRSKAYATLGIDTINRTDMMIDSIGRYMGKPGTPGAAGAGRRSGGTCSDRAWSGASWPGAGPCGTGRFFSWERPFHFIFLHWVPADPAESAT